MNKLTLMFIFILSFSYGYSIKEYFNQLKYMSPSQKQVFNKTWRKAAEFDLSYTMTAIAFKESSLGRIMFNTRDGELGSYGVFHNLVGSVYQRYVRFKPLNRNKAIAIKLKIAQRLVEDYDFSFSQSLAELKYWENYAIAHGKGWDKWRLMVVRYNGGTLGNKKPQSLKYYKEIVKIVKAIKLYRYYLKNKRK